MSSAYCWMKPSCTKSWNASPRGSTAITAIMRSPLLLVGILNGSVVFFSDLIRALQYPLLYRFYVGQKLCGDRAFG